MNLLSTVGFVPPSVYIGFCAFLLLMKRSRDVLRVIVLTPLLLGLPGGLEIRTWSVAGYTFIHRTCSTLAMNMVARRK